MIDRIVIENFKSLRRVELSLGRVNLFIGANASGKSNFLDALRVLQGLGNGFTVSEILDGKPRGATNEVWPGIRGGSARTCFAGNGAECTAAASTGPGEVTIDVRGTLTGQDAVPWVLSRAESHATDSRIESPDSEPRWAFRIGFLPSTGRVSRERFLIDEHVIYDFPADDDHKRAEYRTGVPNRPAMSFGIDCHRPAFGQFLDRHASSIFHDLPEEHPAVVRRVAASIANAQRVEPRPDVLRSYSDAGEARRMGDHGESFAALIQAVCQTDATKGAYLSWLQELRPEEVQDVGVLLGVVGEPMFMLKENGREFPAPVLSDGTLRFAALAAAFFQPDMPRLMTMEEIENGIHASRVRVLVELFRRQAEAAKTQIVATTHSPRVLEWLQEEDYETTFVCKRDEEGATEIRPLTEVPHFMEVVRKPEQRISDLFAEGWLEAVL